MSWHALHRNLEVSHVHLQNALSGSCKMLPSSLHNNCRNIPKFHSLICISALLRDRCPFALRRTASLPFQHVSTVSRVSMAALGFGRLRAVAEGAYLKETPPWKARRTRALWLLRTKRSLFPKLRGSFLGLPGSPFNRTGLLLVVLEARILTPKPKLRGSLRPGPKKLKYSPPMKSFTIYAVFVGLSFLLGSWADFS